MSNYNNELLIELQNKISTLEITLETSRQEVIQLRGLLSSTQEEFINMKRERDGWKQRVMGGDS